MGRACDGWNGEVADEPRFGNAAMDKVDAARGAPEAWDEPMSAAYGSIDPLGCG